MGIESRYPFGGYRAYGLVHRFYFHRKEVDGLKDVFDALVGLIKFVDGVVSLFIKIDEHRDRKRKATSPGRLSMPKRKR
jgi:hypothetical protein